MEPCGTFRDQIDAPPVTVAPRPLKLYSAGGVVTATLFGAPMAGCIIMAVNARRLGRAREAWMLLAGGLLVTAALLAVAFAIPDSWHVPNVAFMLVQLMGMGVLFTTLQKNAVESHRAAGGAMASVWKAAAIGLATCVVLMAIVLGIALAASGPSGTLVKVGPHEVYYSGEASEADARVLTDELRRMGFLEDDHPLTIGIAKGATGYAVSFVFGDEALADAHAASGLRGIGRELADGKLGHPLTLWMCDETMAKKKKIEIP